MLVTSVQPKKKKKLWTFNNSKTGAEKIPLISPEPRVQQKSVQSPKRNFSSLLWPTASRTRSKASESRETTPRFTPAPPDRPHRPSHARARVWRQTRHSWAQQGVPSSSFLAWRVVIFYREEMSWFALSLSLPPPSLLLSASLCHTQFTTVVTRTPTHARTYNTRCCRAAGTWAMFLNGERWSLLQKHLMAVWS